MAETALVIDVGTTATKAGYVVDRTLARVASVNNPTPQRSDGGLVEQDLHAVWQSVVQATRDLGPITPELITVTGQMQNLISLGRDGDPLHPAILYSDTRAVDEQESVEALLGPEWPRALGYAPDATMLPAKYRWLSAHRTDVVADATQALFGTHSYVVHRMSGVAAIDPTTAGTTGLLDNHVCAWWQPAADLVLGDLPVLTDPGLPVGQLQAKPAELLGLLAGIPVVHGPGDAGAATQGALGSDVGRDYVYVGTSGWAGQLVDRFDPQPGSLLLPAPAASQWLRAAPLLAAGAVIDWASAALLGNTPVGELDALVSTTCAASQGVSFAPNLGGDRLSGDLAAGGSLTGLGWSTNASTVAAAIIEGVATELRRALDALSPVASAPLVAAGGATRLTTLCQAMADVTGRNVDTSGGVHSTLRGAAELALKVRVEPEPAPSPRLTLWQPDTRRARDHQRRITAKKRGGNE